MSVAGMRKFTVRNYGVKSSFLYVKIEEEIFMRQAPGFKSGSKVCKLKRSIYGPKQVARVWNQAVHGALIECGCMQSQADKCLYYLKDNDSEIHIIIYVDDLLVAGEGVVLMNHIMRHVDGKFSLDQTRCMEEMVRKAGQRDTKTTAISIDIGYYKVDESELFDDHAGHQKLEGMLLYVVTNSRLDIAAVVSTGHHTQER